MVCYLALVIMMSRAYVVLLSSCLAVLLQLCAAGSHSHSPRLLPGPRQPQPLPRSTRSALPHRLVLMVDLNYTNDEDLCPSEGLSGDLLLDVEYRYGINSTAGAPWEQLTSTEITTTDVVSIPFNVSDEVDLVQFQIIQCEYGEEECNCWSIDASLKILKIDMEPTTVRLNNICQAIIDEVENCCRRNDPRVPHGYVTHPISLPAGVVLPTGNPNCVLIDKQNAIAQNCEELQNYIELSFIVSYVDNSNKCNPPDTVDKGIELAIRSSEETEWVPLSFYAVVNDMISGKRTAASDLTPQSKTINIRGYTVPLIQNFTSDTKQVVPICDKRFITSNVQFRWLQSARPSSISQYFDGQIARDSWYLDDITLVMTNGVDGCSVKLQLFDGFNNTIGPYLEQLKSGILTKGECVHQESSVLLFGVNTPTGLVDFCRRARTVILPLNFTCFSLKPTTSSSLRPTPQSALISELYRIMTVVSNNPTLAGIQSSSDPFSALTMLNDTLAKDNIETIVIVYLLSNVLDTASNVTEDQIRNFAELFLTISSDLLASASDPESKPDESEGVAGSSLLILMDDFGLGLFRCALNNISDINSAEIAFTVQEFPQTHNESVEGIAGDGYSISIPPEAFNRAPVNVTSYYYRNMSNLLPANMSRIVTNGSLRLISPVVSSALLCGDQDCGTDALNEPVIIEFTHPPDLRVEAGDEVHCMFWNILSRVGPLAKGEWSTEGCERDNETSSANKTVCLCYHLTHFGVLLSPTGSQLSDAVTLSLEIIGYIGVTVSLVCLVLTAVTFLVLRSLWNMRNYIHINLCISLIISQLIFVIGIDKTGNRVGCQVVAVLLHYFFLVSFMWMLMEGVVLYVSLVRVFVKHKTRYITAFTIASYGLPLLYMGLCIPLGFLLWNDGRVGYGYEEACWLRYDVHFMWAFIVPVILIIICNVGFFIMAFTIMYQHQKRQEYASKVASAKHWVRVAISLVLVMGLTWIIGVVQFHEVLQLTVSYLFTIFIGLQGVLIFILFVPLSKQVREAYTKWWKMMVNESDFLTKHFTADKNISLADSTKRAYSNNTPKVESKIKQNSLTPVSQDSDVVLLSFVKQKDSTPKISDISNNLEEAS